MPPMTLVGSDADDLATLRGAVVVTVLRIAIEQLHPQQTVTVTIYNWQSAQSQNLNNALCSCSFSRSQLAVDQNLRWFPMENLHGTEPFAAQSAQFRCVLCFRGTFELLIYSYQKLHFRYNTERVVASICQRRPWSGGSDDSWLVQELCGLLGSHRWAAGHWMRVYRRDVSICTHGLKIFLFTPILNHFLFGACMGPLKTLLIAVISFTVSVKHQFTAE